MPYLYINESFSLFVGDDGPDNSKHLNIDNITFPGLEEMTQTHHAGGAIGEIDIGGLGVRALTIPFNVTGWDPQIMSKFGHNNKAYEAYTMYGNVRNKNGNKAVPVKAVAFGRLTKVSTDSLTRGSLMKQSHEIKEITHYEFYFNNIEKYYWDFFASIYRIDGKVQNSDELINLSIPGA